MSPWVPRIWIEVWVGTYDRKRRPVNRYVPKIPPFQGGENVVRPTLGWVIDRSFTPVAQQVAPSHYGTTAALQALPMTATNSASVCELVNMCACGRGVNHVMLLSANLYNHTWLAMASSETYGAAHAVYIIRSNNCGKSFQFFIPLAAAVFQVQQILSLIHI